SSESVLGTSQLKLIVDELKQVLIAYSTRKEETEDKGEEERHQATEQQSRQKQKIQHEEILNQVSDCLVALIRIFEANFLPCFNELLFYIVALLGSDNTVRERDIALSIFYEVVQHCQDAAQKYCDICLSFVFKACTDENAYIRKEGCFGIKVFAEYGGLSFKCFVGDAISCLDAVIGCTDTSELDDARARDMAITALGKICKFHPEKLDRAQVVHTWLGYLPLKHDMAAAQIAHDQLCSMVEKADKDLFGPHNINLPKIIVVLGQVLTEATGLASPWTAVRIKDLLKKLMKILPRTL
ncbi:Importin repeat 6, partial [Dillenia turbinata]